MTAATKDNIVSGIERWIAPILIALVGFFAQLQLSDIRSDQKEIKAFIVETKAQNAVLQRDVEYLQKKIDEHEKWLDDLDQKVNN